ncbi:MAG: DinB family protein [Planctomycetota bacterium]
MQSLAEELRGIVQSALPLLNQLENSAISERPHPQKWAKKEILGHLIDSACNNQQKFVRMMQKPELDFPGYGQDEWVDLQNWTQANWEQMLELWQSYNMHLAHLIETIPEQYHHHTITIEGAGPFSLKFVMEDYVEHLKHHLNQILPEAGFSSAFKNVYGA